jgi:hypothetical protein
MIKATTSHGTYYLIDEKNQLAMRVKSDGRNDMSGDSQWFRFTSLSAWDWDTKEIIEGGVQVGKAMYLTLSNHKDYDWRISTNVISIEDYNDF